MAILTLVGAGPGDPELITYKGIKALQEADVILYDALVNPKIFTYYNISCILVFTGKRSGMHHTSQKMINKLIIEYGSHYKHIVRLKGGDPFIFGRAQEEIDIARAVNMEIRVIPGISSCIAAPAAQLIPLTCRGISESFWVITGTTANGEISKDIYLASQSRATVILLMAMKKITQIIDIYKQAGKIDTAVAVIQNATTNQEKCVIGTIKDIKHKCQQANIKNPSIIIVGEVVGRHPSLITSKNFTPSILNYHSIKSLSKVSF